MALLRLQKGEVDVLGDGIPPAKFLEVTHDPAVEQADRSRRPAADRLRHDERQDEAVRRRAGAPGGQHGDQQGPHRPDHQRPRGAGQPAAASRRCRATTRTTRAIAYDVEKAQGSCWPRPAIGDGFETELYVYNTDPNPRIAQAIQQDLAAIGIKAEIKSLAQANVIAAGGTPKTAPMIWSGGMAWIADFPDPSNFYGPILGCGGAVQGGWNWSWYCNKDREAKAAKADAMVKPDEQAGARQGVEVDLRQDHGRRAVGAGLQRAALHHPLGAHRRRRTRSSSIRSTSRSTTTTSTRPMPNKPHHTIHEAHHHFGWDHSIPPVVTVAPGTTLEFECPDASGGQLSAKSTVADVPQLDFARVNPVTGPVFVDGAEPGDALKVTIDEFKPSGFGWTANIPGFGLLADQFTDPALHIWTYDKVGDGAGRLLAEGQGAAEAVRRHHRPRAGRAGPALGRAAAPGRRQLDIRDLSAGTVLYLPVEVAGALFSVGDTHAAQGDGEVCGTAIESPMSVVLDLRPGEGRQPEDAALHHAGTGHPPSRRQGLRGDDRHRPGPDGGGARARSPT